MRLFFLYILGLFVFPVSLFAFDGSCFREVTQENISTGSLWQVAVSSQGGDIVFVQDDRIIPSSVFSTEKNPPIRYTITGISDTSALQDFDSQTYVQIDPYDIASRDIVWTIDLGRVFVPHSMRASFDYSSESRVLFEVSEDGREYFSVSQDAISDFTLRYVRMTFSRIKTQRYPTIVRGVSFFENVNMRILVEPQGTSPIRAYRGVVCDPSLFASPRMIATSPRSAEYTVLDFQKNPLYKNDADQDGHENTFDNCPYITNPGQEDRNYDGRGDACSDDDRDGRIGLLDNCPLVPNHDQQDKNVNKIGDACEFDTDKDGVSDAIDNAIHTPNPDQKDADKDGIGDVMDNCNLYNPDQLDLDKNNRGDVCDRDEVYKKSNDRDGDSLLDAQDNCINTPNPDQKDTDTDRIGDACDNCNLLQNPDQTDVDNNSVGDMCEDTDHDGIDGWRDNCPTIANPDQKDANNNKIGDACEDTDRDTLLDAQDNCPVVYNPQQEDIDDDAIGDACDTHDDRFLESNKYIFMVLIGVFALVFIGGILFVFKKIQ